MVPQSQASPQAQAYFPVLSKPFLSEVPGDQSFSPQNANVVANSCSSQFQLFVDRLRDYEITIRFLGYREQPLTD